MSWIHFDLADFSLAFLSILFEGAPFLILGTVLSGLVEAFLPPGKLERFVGGRRLPAIILSSLLGIVFPMCECGVVPLIRRLILKGMPVSCAMTYLLAAPIVNPVVALSTYAAFRGQEPLTMVILRLGGALVVATIVGVIVEVMARKTVLNDEMEVAISARNPAMRVMEVPSTSRRGSKSALASTAATAAPRTVGQKLIVALRCAGHDFADVGFYLVIGAALASFFNTAVNREVIMPLAGHSVAATGALMVLAFLLSLCSTSDAFIAANLTAFPWSAKLAFLIFGPMMDVKLIFMYGLVFRKVFTWRLAFGLFVGIGALCLLLQRYAS